jgi:hypothetical protein
LTRFSAVLKYLFRNFGSLAFSACFKYL